MVLELPDWRGVPLDGVRTRKVIADWAHSLALRRLLTEFGWQGDAARNAGNDDPGSLRIHLAAMDSFAGLHWDFRGGRERNLAEHAVLSPSQRQAITDSAVTLGQAGRETPRRRHYDVILMTGGMVRAGLVKPRHVADLLKAGLTADHIVFLGAFRQFGGDEVSLARQLGVEGDNEFDAMKAGMARSFPLADDSAASLSVGSAASGRHDQSHWNGIRLSVVAAPVALPGKRRANSADTYRYWAEQARLPGESSVLQVTTPIYVPYQATSAARLLGVRFGLSVETVGTSEVANDLGPHTQIFTPAHHLQELRAAISEMRLLLDQLD